MKEFFSIAFFLFCGIIAFSFFSSTSEASFNSTSINPQAYTMTPMVRDCYGPLQVDVRVASLKYLTINCEGYPSQTSPTIIIKNTAFQVCPTSATQTYILMGVTFATGSSSTCCAYDFWGGCSTYCTGYTCNAVCAPAIAPSSNCQWR